MRFESDRHHLAITHPYIKGLTPADRYHVPVTDSKMTRPGRFTNGLLRPGIDTQRSLWTEEAREHVTVHQQHGK